MLILHNGRSVGGTRYRTRSINIGTVLKEPAQSQVFLCYHVCVALNTHTYLLIDVK